jgi:hypothetical protein
MAARVQKQFELHKSKILLSFWSHLGRKKAPRGLRASTPLTPNMYKASLHHITLRKQEDSSVTRCWHQTCLEDIQQTNR